MVTKIAFSSFVSSSICCFKWDASEHTKMSDYTNQVLRVVVAQICQTIGWHSIQSTPLELLVDILHKYLQEISRETYRHTELYGRTEPNLVDVGLAFGNLSINLIDIEEYINYVDCVGCSLDVPKYPVRKESNLNFLKPGSKEVLTRPVHIPEYLPPIYPEKEEGQNEIVKKESGAELITSGPISIDPAAVSQNENAVFKKPEIFENVAKKTKIFVEDEGRPTREISSVMMTSSGFISPAREGKLPDAKAPIIPEYKSPPLPPPLPAIASTTLPVGNIDSKFDKKEKKKKPVPSDKEGRKKEKVTKESHKRLAHFGDTSEKGQLEKLRPLKKQKNKQKHRCVSDHQMGLSHANTTRTLEAMVEMGTMVRNDAAAQYHQHHHNHLGPVQQALVPMDLDMKPQKINELKLSSEPNKEKLNIFKKISTSKKEREDLSRSPNMFHDSYILSSIPEGTTITPAPPLKHHSHHHHHHHHQPHSGQALMAAASQQHRIEEDPAICVDDESGFISDIAKNIPVPLPPGTTIKAQTPKKPRKNKQQQQHALAQQQQHLDPNLPINLSSEVGISSVTPVNLVKKDIIQNSRLSYPAFLSQKPQKEKKERKKPKAKEPKQKDIIQSPPPNALNILPPVSGGGPSTSVSFDEKNLKNFRENAAKLFFKKMGAGKGENILTPGPNPYGVPPNFPNVHAPIPMFPFYAFPPRPGLIPNPGLFPALQPIPDNPAFNKFLPMMRFGNFGNINKGTRLTSTYDDEPSPLPPIDTEKSYCNVAPLVPDSMKFQLSPTRLKPKTGSSATASTSTSSVAISAALGDNEPGPSGISEVGSSSKITKTNLDSPIEISDDENVKSENEDEELDGGEQNLSTGDVLMKDVSETIGEGGNVNENILGGDVVDDRNEKSEKHKDKVHKKGKKEKEGKIKKKKDKKDKSKNKDKSEKRKEKEDKKDKERIKKLKKEKKKDKMRVRAYSGEESKLEGINPDSQHSTVPKLTLKLGLGNSPQPDSPDGRKLSIKSHSDDMTDSFDDSKVVSFDRRESSPELARISPLVTRPPKQKSSSTDNLGSITAPAAASHNNLVENRLSQTNVAEKSPTGLATSIPSSTAIATVQGSFYLAGATAAGGQQIIEKYQNYDNSPSYPLDKNFSSDFGNKSPYNQQYEFHGEAGGSSKNQAISSVPTLPSSTKSVGDILGSFQSSRNTPPALPFLSSSTTPGLRQGQTASTFSPSATFLLSAIENNRPSSYIFLSIWELHHKKNTIMSSWAFLEDKKSDSEDCIVSTGSGTSATSGGGAQISSGGPGSSSSGPQPPQPVTRGPGRPSKNLSAAHHHHHGPNLSSSAGNVGSGATLSGTISLASTGTTVSHITSSSRGFTSCVTGASPSSGTGIQNPSSSGTGGNSNQTVQTTDAEGNQVWICPACGRVDDGTPMIGCDGCDAWYHWVCVGIQVPPDDNEDWYCRVCIAKKQEAHGADKKRKRKKKNKAN